MADPCEDRPDAAPSDSVWQIWSEAPGAPANGVFSESGLEALLSVAGPEDAAELIACLTADLSSLYMLLADSGTHHDWARLEEQTEMLISVAASVGATSLLEAGRALNAAACNRVEGTLAVRLPATLRAIRDLRDGILKIRG